jgi:Heparinase II/III N-terminus/Heparinase II/III-like protein
MSAVPVISQDKCITVLDSSFNNWTPTEILSYFKTRSNVRYFAVADPAQVTRKKIDQLLLNCFDLNEETYQLNKHFDWQVNPSTDIEWQIMLHKFYYAVGLGMAYQENCDTRYAEKWMELTLTWINTVPMNFLSSDVLGRRIQNWVFAHYYFVTKTAAAEITAEFYQQFLSSVHEQITYLCNHLTPARNHRTLELYSIFLVAVVFPEFKDAKTWLNFSISELVKNIQCDFLTDGVHCELSTDYHHIVLRNFLGIKRISVLNNIALPSEIDEGIKKALNFSMHAHKPDGLIPSLSDGDTGSFLSLLEQGSEIYGCEQMRYIASQGQSGRAPAERSKVFPASGYVTLRSGWGEGKASYQDELYLIFDCGPLGAGNHGHLDLLSFEMAAFGRSLIVDPGRYTYDESGETNWRVLFRGTGYHNTVMVDGKNQTRYEFYKEKFKIRGEAPVFELKAFNTLADLDYVHGIARSYEYPVAHERKIVFLSQEYWVICDMLTATDLHDYDLLFHLSADAQNNVQSGSNHSCTWIDSPHLILAQPKNAFITNFIDSGYVSPTYGIKQVAPIVRFSQQARTCSFYTVIYPYKLTRPTLSVSFVPVSSAYGICPDMEAACLSITIDNGNIRFKDLLLFAHENTDKPLQFQQHIASGPISYIRAENQTLSASKAST